MKRTSFFKRLFCLLMAFPLLFGLAACPAGEPAVSGSGTTTGKNPSGDKPNPNLPAGPYGDGLPVEGAGASVPDGAFALTEHTPNEANAVEASNLAVLFRSKEPEAGVTYRLTDGQPSALSSIRNYNGNGAIIIAPEGVVFNGLIGVTVKNLIIVGSLTLKGCADLTFEEVEVYNPNGDALTADADCANILVKNCRFTGKNAFTNAGGTLTVLESFFRFEQSGLADASTEDLVVMNCIFRGKGTALSAASSFAQIRSNTLVLAADSVGISLSGGLNNLVALNAITGTESSISLDGCKNTSVILNQATSVEVKNATSVYICDNSLGGRLTASDNNYILADGNTYPSDGMNHAAVAQGNENVNGDTLTDVDARAEVGVNEELLPHTNKDLFLEMERYSTVRVGATDTGLNASIYIQEEAQKSPYVILAPGVYAVDCEARIKAEHSNTVLYAYGAQIERQKDAPYNLCNLLNFHTVTDFAVKGLVLGFERQSCGQVYVLEKYEGNKLLVVTGAGMDNEFGNTDPQYYSITGMGAQRTGDFYPYCDTSFIEIKKLDNGLMEMRVSASVYEMIGKGDVLTCRSGNADTTVYIRYSSGISFKDVTVYGNSGGFAFWEMSNRSATTYYRLHNTTKNGPIIDQSTYDRYAALEEQYGVDLEIYTDGEGRLRGSLPHIGSIDATHTSECAQGSVVTSCIFENMCDDATNQNHHHGRVEAITDNGDGTATVLYKGNYSEYSYATATAGAGSVPSSFCVGDRVFIYNAEGRLVCDTPALSVTEEVIDPATGARKFVLNEQRKERWEAVNKKTGKDADFYVYFYTVTVKAEDVSFAALEGYDMTDNRYQSDNKVLIDNMSMASNGFSFDNMLMQNIRSRGLLIKASEGRIVNCTFKNIGMACAAILYEIYWGESGVSENLEISRNVMDHTGFFAKYTPENETLYSPVCIEGLGSRVEAEYLLYKNIKITDNIMRNRTTEFAVYVNSACDVKIAGNDFGAYRGGDTPDRFAKAIRIMGAMNIEIADNTYSPINPAVTEVVVAEHNKNVFGKDVEWDGESVIPDSE